MGEISKAPFDGEGGTEVVDGGSLRRMRQEMRNNECSWVSSVSAWNRPRRCGQWLGQLPHFTLVFMLLGLGGLLCLCRMLKKMAFAQLSSSS